MPSFSFPTLPLLTITLSRRDTGDYDIELAFSRPTTATDRPPARGVAKFDFDFIRKFNLDPDRYGQLLAQNLFASSELWKFFGESLAIAQATSQPYRMRLRIHSNAPELNDLRWEILCHPDSNAFLALDANLRWSREIYSPDWSEINLRPKGELRALIAIANPGKLKNGVQVGGHLLAEVDVAGELERARSSLFGIGKIDELYSPQEGPWQVTLENLVARLRQGYDMLYLVCHGALLPKKAGDAAGPLEPRILLEKADGDLDFRDGNELVIQVAGMEAVTRLRLIVLAACQSGGKGQVLDPEAAASGDRGALAALGPRLAQVGVPAVLAMQDSVKMKTVEKFMPVFFEELLKDGHLERAMTLARRAAIASGRVDWWVPVLYTRLKDGLLWEPEEVIAAPRRQSLPPKGELSEPGDLPPGSRLPFPRYAHFTGRQPDLLALADKLFYGSPLSRPALVISAMGGMGKSQLAVELAYRYGRFLDGVHWINAAADISAEIAACGQAMHLEFWPEKLPDQVAATIKTWQEGKGSGELRLLVLDNLEEPQTLGEWLPQLSGLSLLVTSRRTDYAALADAEVFPLEELPRPESRALLRKLAPHLEQIPDAELDVVAERFSDLPLGLQGAGTYMGIGKLSPQGYLDRLEVQGGDLRKLALPERLQANPLKRDLDLWSSFSLSMERLKRQDPTDLAARRVFLCCGYCAANSPIPEGLLQEATGSDAITLRISLESLFNLSLLGRSERGPTIHPLHAEFSRWQGQLEEEYFLEHFVDALAVLADIANQTGVVAGMLPLMPHLRQALAHCLPSDRERAALLSSWLGGLYQDSGDLAAARPYLEQALAVRRAALGEEHPDTASSLNNLGSLLQAMGDYAAARPFLEQALAVRRAALGEEHPDTASSLNNLGSLLQAMGDYAAARPYFEQALAMYQAALGERHPDTATSLNNLGYLLKVMGDLAAARPYYEQALAIRQATLGERHPDTAQSLNNLGFLLEAMGDLAAARPYLEQALAIYRAALGDGHPDTATSLNNLGYLLQSMGDPAAARPYLEQALAIRRAALGEEHPDTAQSLNNLGGLLQAMGDLAAARPYYEQALAIYRAALGEEHPSTVQTLLNLVVLLVQVQNVQQSGQYLREAISATQSLPDDHPSKKKVASFLRQVGLAGEEPSNP